MPYAWLKDGTPLYYTDRGTGRPLVLLQALMFPSEYFWQKNLDELAKSCRVIAVDMRSQGRSGKPSGEHTIDRLADDLKEFLDQMQLDRPVLAGLALGGLTLLRYVEKHGQAGIAGLALLDFTPRLVSAPGWDHPTFGNFPPEAAAGFGAGVRADRTATLRGFLQGCFSPQGMPDPATFDEMFAELWTTPTEAVAQYCDDMVKADFRAVLPGITVPTLLMYGGSNPVLPTGVGRWMQQQIPGSRLVEYENAGHCLFWEEPARFNRDLAEFVASV
jgi:non-heme chloroperoxidase